MSDDGLPDLSPAALSHLVAGMTIDQVEAVVGPHFRPKKLQNDCRYHAWIGEHGMLRAFFDGQGGTLSRAVLDVPEEQRVLDLAGDRRRRLKQATINRTWYCVPCRRRYRQPQSGRKVICATCGGACQWIVPGIRVPSPRHTRVWDRFWDQYRAERELLDAYERGKLREAVKLDLLKFDLPKTRRTWRT